MPPTSASGIYLCQYWVKEPPRCSKWSTDKVCCTDSEADFFPFCNLIGTQTKCGKYDGDIEKPVYMCVRPDPFRTTPSRDNVKWVNLPILDSERNLIKQGNYNPISCYNEGNCDGYGSCLKCTGYMPFNMAFSALEPDDAIASLGYDVDDITTTSGLIFRLPLNFKIYNLRAKLSRCYWWAGNATEFTVDDTGVVQKPQYLCCNSDGITDKFMDFYYDPDLNMYVPPCNGAKPECPYYTGVCWEYCIDEYMRHGDYVSAEQILELRYYLRKDRWDFDKYYESFYEGDIYAWDGYLLDAYNIVPSHRVYFVDFDYFNLDSHAIPLSAGMSADGVWPDFPTLVRELKDTALSPIIRNVFDQLDNKNVFETSNLDHKYITIFGDQFYYGSDTYAFNLNDPDLSIPSHIKDFLLLYDNLEAARAGLIETFDDVYSDYKKYIEFLINSSPEHMIKSNSGSDHNMFYIDVPSFFGENVIVVINNGNGEWDFDKISFTKIYVGGVVGQTKFTINGEGEVNYLPSYEDNFVADVNKNGEINFQFFYFTSYKTKPENDIAYIYLDGVKERLSPSLSHPLPYKLWKLNYKLYKRKVFSNLELDISNVKFFGNAGYALVIIPDNDKLLTDVIKPWEIEGIKLCYGEKDCIEMVVVDKCNDKLELNQCIIKPKNIKEFSQVCNDAILKIDNIYIYERHTASEIIDDDNYEEIREDFINDDDVIEYGNSIVINNGKSYSIKQFSDMPIVPSVVFRGCTGRIRGQFKTKLITWIRQPYCRDVEIFYNWRANYFKYKLLPEFVKYGPIGVEVYDYLVSKSYTPPCGDHDLSLFTETGPMWYPYDSCDDYARYNIVNNIVFDTGIMEVFNEDYPSEQKHGKHDMRMLGPADNFGDICGIHSTIWTCHEDWSYCNLEKRGKNIFSGYARYRGGLSYADKLKAIQFGGLLPKFGNVYRDFLRSFRSIDNIDYYVWTGSDYVRKSKWVPTSEFYSIMDLDSAITEYPYFSYISNDFYNDKSLYIDQFGLLQALTIENVDINEELIVDEDGVIRFRFDDLFRPHWIGGIYYPYPKELYLVGTNLIPVISWYTYKDNPLGDMSKSIQWVWREKWKDLVRFKIEFSANWKNAFNEINGHYINTTNRVINNILSVPYKKSNGEVRGRHLFLDIMYPPYKYDFMIKEHRLVCDEGDHAIKLYAPSISDDLTYSEDDVWKLQLNDGPIRCFNADGEWLDQTTSSGVEGCDATKSLYKTCTKDPWVFEVSLFDTGYVSIDEPDDRTIIIYDEAGEEVRHYYHRGLDVQLKKDNFEYIPYELKLLDSDLYQIRLSDKPSFDSNEWSGIESTDYFYPASRTVKLDYNCELEDTAITLFNADGISIGGVSISFKIGAFERFYEELFNHLSNESPIFSGDLYHIPGIKIYISNDDKAYELVYENDKMILYNRSDSTNTINVFYELSLDIHKRLAGSKYIKLVFRLKPTTSELEDAGELSKYYDSLYVTNHVFIDSLYLYYIEFVDAIEDITTYERKYMASIGGHGDFPPHGYESTGSLLYKLPSDSSTVYQMDSIYGVVGMPGSDGEHITMNKLRGRIMEKCHKDKEAISGPKDPHYYETLQKIIHDNIVNKGSTSFTMKSYPPPSLSEQLAELGISFPVWECSFENTFVRPLAEIISYNRYSPCGHKFQYDFSTLRSVPCILCGHGMPVPCVWKDIYDRVFVRACDDYKQVPNTAIVAYFKGTANVLIRPFEYFMEPTIERFEKVSYSLKSWKGNISLYFPEAVRNLY